MILEKVLWTVLPNHFDANGRLRISVHVAPRLVNHDGSPTGGKLDQCPAFIEWPARLATLSFKVEFDGGVTAEAIPESQADSALWSRLFPPDTPLQPFVFQDHAKRNLHVFPVKDVHRFLQQSYGAAGAVGTDHPSIDDAFGPLAHFAPLENLASWSQDSQTYYEELARARQPHEGNGKVVHENLASSGLTPAQQTVQNKFFEAYRFYRRPGSQNPDLPDKYIEPSPKVPTLDFHQRVSAFADHPVVLRKLGLVVDLVVELETPQAQLPATGSVRVIPGGNLPESPPLAAWTRYEFDHGWFGARPQQKQRVQRGLVNLSAEFWELFQVDVDGAALQAVGFADTLRRMRDPLRRSHATPSEAAVPAIRSAGLALARTSRGEMLLEDLLSRRAKNDAVEAGQPPTFDAEDLVRGYRVDVRDADAPGGAQWFSLHRRIADHEAPPLANDEAPIKFQIEDEGYVKASAASSERDDHPSPSDDLYLHEAVFGWEGWSLSVPRPGKRIMEPKGDETAVERHDPAAADPPLITRLAPTPKTLPRLRVGHHYRLRARTVDLAGNSRPFDAKDLKPNDPALATQERKYLRFEPVASPTVLRRHRDTEGESLEHLVIRSDLGTTAASYANRPDVVDALAKAGAAHAYTEDSQRHLAAPKSSQLMAEQDGKFDTAFGGTAPAMTAALRVALREEGTFLDKTIVDTGTGQKTVPQTTIDLVPPGTQLPAHRGDGLPGGAYAFYPDGAVVLPYLPDPFAIGVALTGYDRAGVMLFHQVALFDGAWPALQPFRLRLSEGALSVAFANGVLEVRLPQSEAIRARLSSVFPDNRLEDFGIWAWILAPTTSLKKAALEGRHWMLTPFRWLTLTHAVQRPLAEPDMTKVQSGRDLGSTFAAFSGPIANHAKSTGRLDVRAEWTEDVDLLTEDNPRMQALGTAVPHAADAFGFDIEWTENQAEVAKPGRVSHHEFGDTKYRRIVYHTIATTRFREFLPRPIADDAAVIQRVESTVAGGGTKPGLVHHVPSTARPAAPEIMYVLPAFKWEKQDGAVRRHIRRGNAVRVWLGRPWFSSGDGEQLAVVLEPGSRLVDGWKHVDTMFQSAALESAAQKPSGSRTFKRATADTAGAAMRAQTTFKSSPASELASEFLDVGLNVLGPPPPTAEEIRTMLVPYVTQWGSDPVWESALPLHPPTVGDFLRRVGFATDLTLDELSSAARVVVAAHDVFWSPERKLWYCDIEINAGNPYFPFVRLALARYQPHSVTGAHLSRVVMTDFIQLAPDRTAELSFSGSVAGITVSGFSGRNGLANISRVPWLSPLADLVGGPGGGNVVGRAGSAAIAGRAASPAGLTPNTTMRAALQRRVVGVPGDLGWQTTAEVTLSPNASNFHVVSSGSLALPAGMQAGSHRILVTESETYLRTDIVPGDPNVSTSPLDFVRERVVYADVFEL
jgi:hypothetical protein